MVGEPRYIWTRKNFRPNSLALARNWFPDSLEGKNRHENTATYPTSQVSKLGRSLVAHGISTVTQLLDSDPSSVRAILGSTRMAGIKAPATTYLQNQAIGPEGFLVAAVLGFLDPASIPARYESARRTALYQVMEPLVDKQRDILERHYGIQTGFRQTFDNIARESGKVKIRRLETSAFRRLQRANNTEPLLPYVAFPYSSIGWEMFGENYDFFLLDPKYLEKLSKLKYRDLGLPILLHHEIIMPGYNPSFFAFLRSFPEGYKLDDLTREELGLMLERVLA